MLGATLEPAREASFPNEKSRKERSEWPTFVLVVITTFNRKIKGVSNNGDFLLLYFVLLSILYKLIINKSTLFKGVLCKELEL
jgi:hypothetical protein